MSTDYGKLDEKTIKWIIWNREKEKGTWTKEMEEIEGIEG